MRGGICCIAKIHSIAINKYMKSHDEHKESKFITHFDANKVNGYIGNELIGLV